MCAFLIPHRSTNTAVLSLQGMQFQGTRWDRLWTQPWGDQLLSEGTRWLSPHWRGKSSSLSVLVVNKLEVLYQPLRALHHDERECYKVLIIKTCQCVCVFSKALVVVPVWNHDVQQPHSARYCEDMIQHGLTVMGRVSSLEVFVWLCRGLFFRSWILMLQHTETFRTISCSGHFGNSLGNALSCSNVNAHHCTMQGPQRHEWESLV